MHKIVAEWLSMLEQARFLSNGSSHMCSKSSYITFESSLNIPSPQMLSFMDEGTVTNLGTN